MAGLLSNLKSNVVPIVKTFAKDQNSGKDALLTETFNKDTDQRNQFFDPAGVAATPKAPPPPLAPPAPVVMPTPDDTAVQAARRRSAAAQQQRSGRSSTILSGNSASDTLG